MDCFTVTPADAGVQIASEWLQRLINGSRPLHDGWKLIENGLRGTL